MSIELLTDSALKDKIMEVLNAKKHTDVIDALRPNSTLTLDTVSYTHLPLPTTPYV